MGTFEKPNKNWRIPRKKIIDRNWTITTCLLRDSNPNYQCLKITSCSWRPPPRMHSFIATTHFKSFRSFVSLCVCCMHKRTGTFEMRSGSERMHTWMRTPSTGLNFQTLIIWITVSYKASCNGSISVNNFFFLGFLQFLLAFSKVPDFLCHPVFCFPPDSEFKFGQRFRVSMINGIADFGSVLFTEIVVSCCKF